MSLRNLGGKGKGFVYDGGVRTLHLATEIIECVAKSSLFLEEKIAALEIAKLAMIAEGRQVTSEDALSPR